MSPQNPPKAATWLLKRLNGGYRSESLAGDLIERYAEGRSRGWFWRQLLAVAFAAARRGCRARWRNARRVLFRLLAGVSAMLGAATVLDHVRRPDGLREMWSSTSMATVTLLTTVAAACFLLSRPQGRAVSNLLKALFAVAALSAGTLTWAAMASR